MRRVLRIVLAVAALTAGLALVSSAVAIRWTGDEPVAGAAITTPAASVKLGTAPLASTFSCGALALAEGSLSSAYVAESCGAPPARRHGR